MLILCRMNYTNKDKDRFLRHFDMNNWEDLPVEEKLTHQFSNCGACSSKHRETYYTLRRNMKTLNIIQLLCVGECKNHIVTKEKENLIKVTFGAIAEPPVSTSNTTVPANNVSFRIFQSIRMTNTLEKLPIRPSYKIKHDRFLFDRAGIKKAISDMSATGEKVNFSKLSRDFPVHQQDGKIASNGNQVLKEYALDEGIIQPDTKVEKRERRGKRKLQVHGTAFSFASTFPSDQQIKQETQKKLK